MLNLDTHILLFAVAGTLKPKENHLLSSNQWCISSIVLWEIAKLSELNRIELDIESPHFSRILSQIYIIPIDWAVCKLIHKLDFKSDPADQIIAVTSIHHKIPLVTRDKVLLKSKMIPFAK